MINGDHYLQEISLAPKTAALLKHSSLYPDLKLCATKGSLQNIKQKNFSTSGH